MYIPLILLKEVKKPMKEEEIEELQLSEDDTLEIYKDQLHPFDDIDCEKTEFDKENLTEKNNGKLIEIVEEDKKRNINHIFVIKQGAKKVFAEEKIKQIKKTADKLTPENYRLEICFLENNIVDKYDCYISTNNYIRPFDDWFVESAEEGVQYQIIQIINCHI